MFFYITIDFWKNKNLVRQEFSNLKTSIYDENNNSVFFNSSVNISVLDNSVLFNSSHFSFSKSFNNVELNPVELIFVNSVRVYEQDGSVVIE